MERVEHWFEQLGSRMTGSVRIFSTSLFLLVSAGMIYGLFFVNVVNLPAMLLIPPVLAVLAYYNRTFALAVLALTVISFI